MTTTTIRDGRTPLPNPPPSEEGAPERTGLGCPNGCFVFLFTLAVIALSLLGSGALLGCAGERVMRRGEHQTTVAPGETLLIPAEPGCAERDRAAMRVWQCPACGTWLPDEFPTCSCASAAVVSPHGDAGETPAFTVR